MIVLLFQKNKKFIVINIGLDFEFDDKILIDNNYIKIIEMHLYQILRNCIVNNNKYEYSKLNWMVYNNLNKKGKIRSDRFNNTINENRIILNEKNLKNFGYLFKLNLIDLIVNEDIIYMNVEYNLNFIFNNIAWSNIVYLFKIYGINLYGGSNSRRHLLSTVQTVQTKLVSS
uniref:Uncharacterized protein n=1 Tax=Tricholoma saponaceum TaxID=113602 RepID=A0A6C0W3U5_9AGAR|nr:hypothetical protein [Tricholoma saponaceum]QIC20295.1 hypothetical protein [Tricholoma saponaceum]